MTMTEQQHDTPRIYAASLTDYNAGRLHGVWIDLDETTTADDIGEAVAEMLKRSPEARAFPQGGPAEEWAIHDYEGFGGIRLGEWESFERVAALARGIAEHGPAFAAWISNDSSRDPDEYEPPMFEADNGREIAEEWLSELGWNGVEPKVIEELGGIIDVDHVAHEIELSCDWVEHDGRVYVWSY